MNYSKLQRYTSSFLIFSILVSFTIRIPFSSFLENVFASDNNRYNIVALIVDEDLYDTSIFSSDVKTEIDRYAGDIQNSLSMTKVMIFPTKSTENPHNIASLLEKLYQEGYKGINGLSGESSLIGAVFVGNIPLPILYNENNSQKSVVPYVDFDDKSYIYNSKTEKYEKNSSSKSDLKAEIWHSFISPNTGNRSDDVKDLKKFFNKDHDYYTKNGNFSTDLLKNNKPYVFYFDSIREQEAISLQEYNGYLNFLNNLEDISYNRFYKYLANKLTDSYLGNSNEEIKSMISSLGLDFDLSQFSSNGPDLTNSPDITTKDIITKTVKRFVEIFNSSSIGEMKEYVHNAGRYNGTGTTVSADLSPSLITNLDEISRIMVKDANNELEKNIDNLVKNGLSRNIAIPTEIRDNNSCGIDTYTNIIYGQQASNINTAEDCSIYRGSNTNSGNLVEANRGLNINLIQTDISKLTSEKATCANQTSGRFGGNSPINLDTSSMNSGDLKLSTHDLTKSITPIFDIAGSKKISDNSKVLSPLNCLSNNFIVTEVQDYSASLEACETTYSVPINGKSAIGWSCSTTNKNYSYTKTFEDLYKEDKCNGLGCSEGKLSISFKQIPSYIQHKSPTSAELTSQIKAITSPNLPVDRDRYVDFISSVGTYDKINYPYLYRLTNVSSDLTIDGIKKSLKEYLDKKSDEINSKIKANNPNNLTGKDNSLYSLLKTGNYPNRNIDLYKIFESKPEKTLNIDGDNKTLSYLDTLVFSLYWTKLNSVSAKYKFIFENYLSDQFGNNNIKFPLPANKKMYEIAYLGASGDSQNMYINIDPAKSADNPYADIIAKNVALNNNLLSTNIGSQVEENNNSSCGPPEGVPLWQWIPAVMCRLTSLLPPKIGMNGGSCGTTTVGLSESSQNELDSCNKDSNKNGIIDCQEKINSINLSSVSEKYSYNTTGNLQANILDANGNLMDYDTFSDIGLELLRVDSSKDITKNLTDSNRQTIYNKESVYGSELNNSGALEKIKEYIVFNDIKVKAKNGKAEMIFSSKNKDADLYFRASFVAKDNGSKTISDIKSNILVLKIRGDALNVTSYSLDNNGLIDGSSSVKASDKQNIFIIDGNNNDLNSIKSILKDASSSKEKLIFDLKNFSKEGKKINLFYPIKVELYKNSIKIEDLDIPSISSYKGLFSLKEAGDYEIHFTDSNSTKIINNFQILADTPNEIKVDMSTNSTDVGGVVTNHIISLYDKYGNINSAELYDIKGYISGNSVSFENGNSEETFNMFEGFKNFKLKSTDSSGESEIKFVLKDNLNSIDLEKKVYIKTISDIKSSVSIENENSIKVGGNTYKYKLEIKDSNGNLLTDFNSKAYLNIDSVYGSSLDNVINIKQGIGEGSFKTTTIAGKAVNLNFSVEGLKNSISKTISIHPDKAMKIDMILANSKLEAKSTSSTNLALELKDRYGNLVFDDNSTKLKLEIPDSYKHILHFSTEEKQVSGGKINFTINATDIPGIAYLKVSSNPNLRENNFSVNGQTPFLKTELNNTIFKNSSGLTSQGEKFFYEIDSINYRFKANSLESLKNSSDYLSLSSANKSYLDSKFEEFNSIKIYGVGENAIKLETYYFWNKSSIIDKKYNSLYTALLGSSYGDFTKKDYLAGAMLFDENNRSLAVSSLLNNPLNYSNLLNVSPSGNITQNDTDDLTQDISITYSNSSKNLNFNIFNKALNTYIGKIYFKGENNLLPVCTKDDIDDCYSEATGIFGKLINSSYKIENLDNKIVLKNEDGNILFSISKDLLIENNGVSININTQNTKDYLLLDLDLNGETIASIGIKLNNSKIDLSRDEGLFTNKINTISDGIFVFLQSYNYGTTEDYTATSTNENKGISIYYNDPFSTNSTNSASSIESNSFANFENKAGIGWGEDNKTLLLLSAGENVGDATKNYQSLSSINLGDPVISLAKKDPKLPGTDISRKFDSSIGELLGKGVKSYAIFDYNNDGLDDIVYLTDNGFIKLYEQTNTEEKFKDLGNLFYLADIDDEFDIIAGDFTGDNFDDVFFVDTSGKPVLLNNDKKHFSRIDLYDKFGLNSRISQIVGFDMNNDKKYDLVILDEEGYINIFYGGGSSFAPQFTKNNIDSGYALKLNGSSRTDLGAIYFDGLYQLPKDSQADFLSNSEKLNEKIKSYNEAIKSDPNLESSLRLSKTEFNEDVIDKLLFLQLNYDPENTEEITTEKAQNNILSSMPNSLDGDTSSISSDMKDAKTRVSNFFSTSEILNPNGLSYSSGITNSNKITTFLRSEYSSVEGVSINKTYIDKNGDYLKSGDKINVKVEITNNKSSTIKNVSYLDKVPDPLTLTDETIFKFKKGNNYTSIIPKTAPDGSEFNFMIDHFDLSSKETVVLEYTLDTSAFSYGYIDAGLYEKGELGDDSYGDIIVKNNGENCGEANIIYRSTSQTKYDKGEKEPTCDDEKSSLPEEVEKNSTDTDNNGVPDYIDALKVNNGQNEAFLSYSKEKLNTINFDTDSDGVPDTNDINEDYNEEEGDILGSLNNFTDSSMKTLNGVEKMINGLGCGFGNASCIASPLNWAPLASGSDPTLFGCPVGDGLNVGEGLPILSLFTGLNIPTPGGCYQAPVFWPMSPFMFLGTCNTSLGAGGRLGTTSPTNTFRLFVTPTITGGVGVEACFGGPAIVAGNIPTKGASPIVPGGNCIVTAFKSNMCSDDGSDGDVGSIGYSEITDYDVINANCSTNSSSSKINSSVPNMDTNQVSDYINYKRTGQKTTSLVSNMKSYLSTIQNSSNYNSLSRLNSPLINLGSSNSSSSDFNLTLNTNSSKNGGGFSDILKIDLKRVFPFPDFLMEWWTRQIEEIVTKLTDWPTIFVILPDFSGIFNSGWNNFFDKTKSKFNKGRETQAQKNKIIDQQINALNAKDCGTDETCKYNQALKKRKLQASKYKTGGETMSGIRQVYEFLGNLPMISIGPQAIDVNIPWADSATISKAIIEWETTKNQWQAEMEEKQKIWSGGEARCDSEKTEQAKAKCKSDYAYSNNLALNSSALLASLNQNIATLKEYKKIPEKVNKMLKIKEVRLSQILCNVETITKITGGRLGQNGKRFKSWIQLYITVKAILKSWQLILDIFYEYDASCHDCKNERSDLLYCVFKLVSMIIPKIPVIQFPKWPDIIVDLHNVRANLDVNLPDYKFNLRPITIPSLGNLGLPNLPNASFSLPKIPTLPKFALPELPDLPTLPTVTLPDLPPPPKLPKLFAGIEAVLDILKLITKVMCILKKNPFVPEWRAGDQISFLTERSGYLPFDFLDLALPQFSYPFVDAIKVTSFVNLEFESDFITEFSRNMVLPINSFANNIVNIFDYKVSDIDMSQTAPSDVNVKVGTDGSTDTRIDGQKLNYSPKKGINLYDFSMIIAKKINDRISYSIKKSDENISSNEFISLVNNDLAKTSIIKDNKTEKLRDLWKEVNNYNYSKEDKIINNLIKNNTEKFDTLKSIIKEEIKYNKELEKKFRENKLSIDNKNILISSNISRIDSYKASLEKFNNNTINSIINLTDYQNEEENELKTEGNKILTEVKTGAEIVIEGLNKSDLKYTTGLENIKNNLLATTSSGSTTISSSGASCSTKTAKTGNTNQYSYKGLYVIENNISYRLFDYLGEITGDEEVKSISRLNNSDKDLIYQVGDELYLKSNYKAETKNVYYNGNPIIVDTDDIKFYNNSQNSYIPSINGFSESIVDSNNINVAFSQPKEDIANFRIEFFNIVDKFDNLDNTKVWNGPDDTRKQVIDAFRDIDNITLQEENENYAIRKNLAYLDYYSIGNDISLSSKEFVNIKDKLENNTVLNVSLNTKIYSGKDNVKLFYHLKDEAEELSITLDKHTNISFANNITITGIEGEAYLESNISKIYSGTEIYKLLGLPILPGTKIVSNSVNNDLSHLDINYYDGSNINILFRETNSYTLYDLGNYSDDYLVRTKVPNDFYYSKISGFKSSTFSTVSNQSIFSPQLKADNLAPELDLDSGIKVPVYISKEINLTDNISENGGISNLKEVYIDSNLQLDSDSDGDATNDKDNLISDGKNKANIEVLLSNISLKLKILAFDNIFTKNIRIYLVDKNNNVGYKDVSLQVYAPIPEIKSDSSNAIIGTIGENLLNEKIDLYRLRGGSLKRLTKDSIMTDSVGGFSYKTDSTKGLILKKGDTEIASINEITGIIDLKDKSYKINVIPANKSENGYTNIVINDGTKDIYYEYIVVPDISNVKVVSDFSDLSEKGVYFKMTNKAQYSYSLLPSDITNNAGEIIVYDVEDTKHSAIFSITKDGRINILNNNFKIEYETFKEKPIYKLIRNDGVEVARSMPISEGNFIMK